jgi:hypothetical protein
MMAATTVIAIARPGDVEGFFYLLPLRGKTTGRRRGANERRRLGRRGRRGLQNLQTERPAEDIGRRLFLTEALAPLKHV